jgi:Capsule polysaccharide biosynthesis protein
MSPLPERDRLAQYAIKGVHLGLRRVGEAPEMRAARRLRSQAPSPPPGAPRVLILSPRDWAAHVQWEAMIGQALRLRGADVRFVTCGGGLEICDRSNTWEAPPMPCRSCASYVGDSVAAHGFPLGRLKDGWSTTGSADWPELDGLSLSELVHVEWAGLPLGRLMDIPAKWFLMGTKLEDDPLGPLTMRRFLRAGRQVIDSMSATLDGLEPDVVLLLNGLFFFESIAWEICRRRDIDVVTYERSFIKETLTFRRGAPACMNDVSHLWPSWRNVPLTVDEEHRLDAYLADRREGRRTIDRLWQAPVFELPDVAQHGRLVTLFTNLTWDSAVIGQEVAFASIQDWLAAAVNAFAGRLGDALVVRIHPAEMKLPGKLTREPLKQFLDATFPVLPANVHVIAADDPLSSYPLMEKSDLGLVFTSTTGLELALNGTPVIVAGRTHYRDKGFTLDAASPAAFSELLDRALADPVAVAPDVALARRYAYLFFFRAPVASPGVEEHVPGLARLTTSDLDELRPGHNRDVDRICDGILCHGDFVG